MKYLIQSINLKLCSPAGILYTYHTKLQTHNIIKFSLRTDKGVHAFCTSAHFDLQHFKDGMKYSPEWLHKGLTRYMEKCNAGILIRDIKIVPPNFSARHSALHRSYLYRLGVKEKPIQYPVAEWKRCVFISEPFCFEKAKETCKTIHSNGETRNYASFCHGLSKLHPNFPTTRKLDVLDITEGRPLLTSHYDPLYEGIRFYDVNVKGRAFMYKQVRRMVGVIIAVAQNRMTIDQVEELFIKPGEWNCNATTAPPHGLYLLDVAYGELPKDDESE